MTILVTGGAGRLGRELINIMRNYSYTIKVLDLPNTPWRGLQEVSGVQIIQGDITDSTLVSESCESVNAVIHLAALLPPKSEVNRELTMNVNAEGTRNIVEALKSKKDVPLILASSISTYGSTMCEEPPIKESHTLHAHNLYSESKIAAERLLKESRVPHVTLRIAPLAIADLVELPDIIPYKADQRVEFIYVEDAARALHSAMTYPEARGQTYNISGGPSWQMTGAKYIERFYEALGVDVEPNFNEEYTAIDWYDTSKSVILDYQRVTFDKFLEKLQRVAIELGLI